MPIVRTLCVMFIEFIRGVPLITLLFIASTMLNYFLPPGTSFNLILRVLIMVTLFAAAYIRSEEHTSELQSLMRISYAVFCLKKKNRQYNTSTQLTAQCTHH